MHEDRRKVCSLFIHFIFHLEPQAMQIVPLRKQSLSWAISTVVINRERIGRPWGGMAVSSGSLREK